MLFWEDCPGSVLEAILELVQVVLEDGAGVRLQVVQLVLAGDSGGCSVCDSRGSSGGSGGRSENNSGDSGGRSGGDSGGGSDRSGFRSRRGSGGCGG